MAQTNLLSNREKEVVALLLQGKSNKLIAAALGISVRTVEFHLKNIYLKHQVSSRVELILQLGNTPGGVAAAKPGSSPVEAPAQTPENREQPKAQTAGVTALSATLSTFGEEIKMKNLLTTKHVIVSVMTALFTGCLWVFLLRRIGHMALSELMPWVVPLLVCLTLSGLAIGFFGQRNGSPLLKVGFSTLVATGLSPIAILPLMGFVVLPIAKLSVALGLINRAAMSSEVTDLLVITVMLALWLALGVAGGSLLLVVPFKKIVLQTA